MQIFHSPVEMAALHAPPSIVTVGNFDGVHCGHRAVLANVIEQARTRGLRSVAVTFAPHPVAVLQPQARVELIQPLAARLDALADCGLDATLVLPFTPEFSRWSAHDFAARVLRDALRAVEVHEGENFRFGFNAAADLNGLVALGGEMGFTVRAYEPVVLRGAPVSSTRIRRLIQEGAVHRARPLLGRPFALDSTPAAGRGYGTRYAVPTINLALTRHASLDSGLDSGLDAGQSAASGAARGETLAREHQVLPADGVYITTLRVGQGSGAKVFDGVTNIGNRPTFGDDSFAIETHLFDFEPVELSPSTPLRLEVLHRLRGEQRFHSTDALRAQIGRDVARAQRYFRLHRSLR